MSWSSVCRRRPLPTLRSSRCCACIVLLDGLSELSSQAPLLLNTDQRLPEAIFMQQQSSAASTQAAEPDLETSRVSVKNPFFPKGAACKNRRYLHTLRVRQHIRALITEPC